MSSVRGTTRRGRVMDSFVHLAVAATLAFPSHAAGQQDAARERTATLVQRLDMEHTDWTLFLDVSDKVHAIGKPAIAVIDEELAGERAKASRRYALRLLGVLARIDRRGIDELASAIDGDEVDTAAVAARILGRSGADHDAVENAFVARLGPRARSGVSGAIAMGASDAGAKAAAAPLRLMLGNHTVRGQDAHWVAVGAGTLTHKLADVRECLAASGSLQKVGILAARTVRDDAVTKRLKELIETTDDGTTWDWIVQAFGAIGDDEVRDKLRQSIEGESEAITSTSLDQRRLALVRLGDAKQIAWALGAIGNSGRGESNGITMQFMGPALAALPELLAKWKVDGAKKALSAFAANQELLVGQRAYVARGLCRLRERSGLELAAELLATERKDREAFPLQRALEVAQMALHDFVADPSRPDYVPIERGAEGAAVEIGQRWQKWLEEKGAAIAWRDAREETEDLLFWK